MTYRSTWDPHVTIFGWWIRFIWGVTFKTKRLRWHKGYGYRMIAIRLWGNPNSRKTARLIGLQWRRP